MLDDPHRLRLEHVLGLGTRVVPGTCNRESNSFNRLARIKKKRNETNSLFCFPYLICVFMCGTPVCLHQFLYLKKSLPITTSQNVCRTLLLLFLVRIWQNFILQFDWVHRYLFENIIIYLKRYTSTWIKGLQYLHHVSRQTSTARICRQVLCIGNESVNDYCIPKHRTGGWIRCTNWH